MTTLNTVDTSYTADGDDKWTAKHTQNISQAFLDDLKDVRNASTSKREGEFMRVASIPVSVVEQWKREGFCIHEHTGAEIVQRMHNQDLTAFLATDKRV